MLSHDPFCIEGFIYSVFYSFVYILSKHIYRTKKRSNFYLYINSQDGRSSDGKKNMIIINIITPMIFKNKKKF